MGKHAAHVCYRCSGTIKPDQHETRVDAVVKYPARYQHASEDDCKKSLGETGIYLGRLVDPEDDAENMYQGRER